MKTVLVDTSVWIEYFNKHSDNQKVKMLKRFIADEENVVLCPMIYQEVLQGIKDEKKFVEIQEILEDFEVLDNDIFFVTKRAISLYRFLRKNGVTIRKSYDCLIAAYALENNVPLLHNDKDFEQMRRFVPIDIL